ncbi:MAG TPA: thioredoxin domain-containing protein [Pyrinomonadaceae bacterium]|nr:thioredoxin domain-containing protein [Pyrinomonadaceae bacterium]
MRRKLPIIIIAVALVAALAGGALMMRSSETSTTQTGISQLPPTVTTTNTPATTATATQPQQQPRPAVPPSLQNAHARGRADAPVLIEEYGDFQCPPCGFVHPILKRIEDEYETEVRVVFRNFPLPTLHQHAIEAARAAEAAGLQGKFWQMHDMLFEKQNEWKDTAIARPLFLGYARQLGLDLDKFTRDIDSAPVNTRVMNDEQHGTARGVGSTPTVFMNGREIPFEVVRDYGKLRATIEQELAAKK